MEPFQIDVRELPRVIITAQGALTAVHLPKHFGEYRALLALNRPYYLVFDASDITSADANVRTQYAEFMKSEGEDLGRLCLACGFVIRSAMIRGALTAVLWVAGGLPFEHRIFGTREEAMAWTSKRYSERQAESE